MRMFEIYDSSKRKREPLAVLYCDDAGSGDGGGQMRIVINPDVSAGELPLMLSLFAERGELELPDKWARKWVEERVPPQGRQNLGEILRANGLSDYDEVALLAAAEGRSSQDDCLVREITPRVDYAFVSLEEPAPSEGDAPRRGWCAVIGPEIAERRRAAGMTQRDLSERSGIDQAAISRIESGKANPTIDTLEALVEGVGSYLLVKIV